MTEDTYDDCENGGDGPEFRKREPTGEELMKCPLLFCDGVMEIREVGGWKGHRYWEVRCSVCHGWSSVFINDMDGEEDPYTQGIRAWEDMRKEMRGGE